MIPDAVIRNAHLDAVHERRVSKAVIFANPDAEVHMITS